MTLASWEKRLLLYGALGMLVLRLLFIYFATPLGVLKSTDKGSFDEDGQYSIIADNVLTAGKYELRVIGPEPMKAWRPPLFPLFIMAVSKIHGRYPIIQQRIYTAVLSLLVPFCVWLLVRSLWTPRAAALAYIWAGAHPHFIFYSGFTNLEGIFMVFSTAAFTLIMLQKRAWHAFAAGALAGLACLGRSQFGGAVLIGMAWPLANPRLKKWWGMVFLAGFVAVFSPWWLRNYSVFHKFIPLSTEGGYTLWVGNNPLADGGGNCPDSPAPKGLGELELDKWHYRAALSYMKDNPGRTAKLALSKLGRFYALYPRVGGWKTRAAAFIAFAPLFAFFLLGLYVWRAKLFELLPIPALCLYYTATQSFFPSVMRYRIALEPLLLVVAAPTLLYVFDKFFRKENTV